jgi:internalin A
MDVAVGISVATRMNASKGRKMTARVVGMIAAATAVLCLSCGGDDKKSTSPDDSTAPSAVADLFCSDSTATSVTLTWTAPGDDGSSGTAAVYDLRYSQAAITEANWDAATQAGGEPSPQAAGATETATVSDLSENTTYYFALKTRDEADNWSGLSNVISATPAEIIDDVAPDAVTDLSCTDSTAGSVTLTWTAPGDDTNQGIASTYDLRYALEAITEGNWNTATEATGEPSPQSAGTTETTTVIGLTGNTVYFFALKTADEAGNWSGVSNVASTGTVADEVVTFPDGNLETAIRDAIGKPTGDIMASDLAALTDLDADNKGISDLTGLDKCANLDMLHLEDNSITDLSPLASLAWLRDLNVGDNSIADLTPLAGLAGLTELRVWKNQVTDMSPLSALTDLEVLNIHGNALSSFSLLATFTKLRELGLSETGITDLSVLSGLNDLTWLHLSENGIADISPLSGLTNLRRLYLHRNQIADLSPLAGMTALTTLYISDNEITNLGPLAGITNLQRLYAENNDISDLTPLAGLTELTLLWLYQNDITDLAPLAGLTNLEQLSLWSNSISNISALAGMTSLYRLDIQSNPLSDITVLQYLPVFSSLNANNTNIADISSLSDLAELYYVNLSNTPVVDLQPLVDNAGFGSGDKLYVTNCSQLSSESINTHIPTLEGRGVTVYQ